MVVAVEDAVSVVSVPAVLTPDVVVVIDCAPTPLVPLKVNVPVPPFEILFNVMLAGVSSLLMVQVAV